jgi:hypothetical protein
MIKQGTYFIGKEFNDNDNDNELSSKAHNLSVGHNSTSIGSLHREIDKAIHDYGRCVIQSGIGNGATDISSSRGPL